MNCNEHLPEVNLLRFMDANPMEFRSPVIDKTVCG